MVGFLTEAMFVAVVGGALGILCALGLQFMEISTTNFDTFSEIAFSFRMSPTIAVTAIIFSIVMGIVGGFLPAVRAARFSIVNALKGD